MRRALFQAATVMMHPAINIAENMGRTGRPPPWHKARHGRIGTAFQRDPAPDVGCGLAIPTSAQARRCFMPPDELRFQPLPA